MRIWPALIYHRLPFTCEWVGWEISPLHEPRDGDYRRCIGYSDASSKAKRTRNQMNFFLFWPGTCIYTGKNWWKIFLRCPLQPARYFMESSKHCRDEVSRIPRRFNNSLTKKYRVIGTQVDRIAQGNYNVKFWLVMLLVFLMEAKRRVRSA
jgi:hypothetical protein